MYNDFLSLGFVAPFVFIIFPLLSVIYILYVLFPKSIPTLLSRSERFSGLFFLSSKKTCCSSSVRFSGIKLLEEFFLLCNKKREMCLTSQKTFLEFEFYFLPIFFATALAIAFIKITATNNTTAVANA